MRVISGAQDGVDMAALRAAKRAGISTGGYVPLGFNKQAQKEYNLQETNYSLSAVALVHRSKLNVDMGDVTIAFRLHPSKGTDGTIRYAQTGYWTVRKTNRGNHRPVLIVESTNLSTEIPRIVTFLKEHAPEDINVAGNRDAPEQEVERILFAAFSLYLASRDAKVECP